MTLVIDAGSDLQEWTTTWTFNANLTCGFERVTLSLVEGIRRVVNRSCTYVDQSTSVLVTYSNNPAPQSLPYSVPLNTTTRLIIEGIEYGRVQ